MPRVADNAQSCPERDRYLELVQKFPLRHIRSDEELMAAINVIQSLISRSLEDGEQDYLDVLSDMVEKYETEEHPMPPVSDAEMLRHLIGARAITQTKLAEDTGVLDSTISEVLNGKRQLTRKQVGIMAKYFGVNQSVFNLPA